MPDLHPLDPTDPRDIGDYTVAGRLGEGGEGVVYLGRSGTGEQVAIKLFHAARLSPDDTFVREMDVAKQVARFCTAQILGSGTLGRRAYIVSEYVDGPSLHRVTTTGGPRTGSALDRLAIATATALVALHDAGVVHRDFKPHNVLLGPDGPRVIDFGISRSLTSAETVVSRALGTPAYMAPEQLEPGGIGPPVDVFAWASTMVFAATGRPPFGNDSIPLVLNRIAHEAPDLGTIEEPFRTLLTTCLDKDPPRRPTAQQILDRLVRRTPTTQPPYPASPAEALPPFPTPPPTPQGTPPTPESAPARPPWSGEQPRPGMTPGPEATPAQRPEPPPAPGAFGQEPHPASDLPPWSDERPGPGMTPGSEATPAQMLEPPPGPGTVDQGPHSGSGLPPWSGEWSGPGTTSGTVGQGSHSGADLPPGSGPGMVSGPGQELERPSGLPPGLEDAERTLGAHSGPGMAAGSGQALGASERTVPRRGGRRAVRLAAVVGSAAAVVVVAVVTVVMVGSGGGGADDPPAALTTASGAAPEEGRVSSRSASPSPDKSTRSPERTKKPERTRGGTKEPSPSPRTTTHVPRRVELGPGHFTAYCQKLGWEWVEYRETPRPGAYCVMRKGDTMYLTKAQRDAGCRWRFDEPAATHAFKGKSNYCYAMK